MTTWNRTRCGGSGAGVAFGNEMAALGHGSGEVCLALGNAQCFLHTKSLTG